MLREGLKVVETWKRGWLKTANVSWLMFLDLWYGQFIKWTHKTKRSKAMKRVFYEIYALGSVVYEMHVNNWWKRTYVGSVYACVLLVGLWDNRQICHVSFLKHTGGKQMGFVTIADFQSNDHCQLPTLTSMEKMLYESIKIDNLTRAKQNKTHLCVYISWDISYIVMMVIAVYQRKYIFVEDSVLPCRNTWTMVILAVHEAPQILTHHIKHVHLTFPLHWCFCIEHFRWIYKVNNCNGYGLQIKGV